MTAPTEEVLTSADVRRRAAAGAAAVGLRGVVVRVIQFIGIVILARLLTPHDFGLVAIGMTVVTLGAFLSDMGFGAALIRRSEPPEPGVIESLLGLQLAVAGLLALGTVAVVAPLGFESLPTAVIVTSLPLLAARAPTGILLERRLVYRPIVWAEVAETVVYYGFAGFTAWLGWGVWALAVGVVVRSVAGTTLLLALAPVRVVRPGSPLRAGRRLVSFGLKYQAVGFTNLARDQGVNLGVALVGGVSTLGLWTFANRILQIPYLLFGALWRVSYPAMSRLQALGEDATPIIERALSRVSVATGAILAPLAGSAPTLVPAVLGHHWTAVAAVIPWPCLGLVVSGPISVAVAGYLYAVGDVATPLRASVFHTIAWLVVSLALLPFVGVQAVGLGWLASCAVDAIVLGRGARRHVRVDLFAPLAPPTTAAILAGGLGWIVASSGQATLPRLAVAVLLSEGVYIGSLLLVRRGALIDTLGSTRRALDLSIART
jgi:O-antigen/teichoic acid export membrane protein